MSNTHVPEPHETNEQRHPTNQSRSKVTYNGLASVISVALPIAMYFIFDKDRFKEDPLLRFATILLPFSYSATQYLFLLYANWKSNYKPEDTLHKALYYSFNALLITFATISILSIVALPIDGWGSRNDIVIHSVILPFFVVWSAYLTFTINCLIMKTIRLTDVNFCMLIALMMMIRIIVEFKSSNREYRYYRQMPTPMFRDTFLPTIKRMVSILTTMLVLATFMYAFIAWKCLIFLRNM
ncbi:hypothetical protein M970_110020 [Encephalitozoon cuniculi EcunIII-L]|uniref:Uncharacterized protein n=1 Tax=Encephalitozoon cuniculi TaxID=6035 RepID=M1JM60_ENCCN|nr:hypothetical protein ECU11_0070 [Encephalitozoon cuniculi]KMV64964.1 hypothetical protein M970_110020 [Encephalitozoon cuniculi EcunIII-L]UYI26202.1 DUF2463 domain-containing protein [Encephalitozoon cuniculi]UYI27963.1 DUF2463 domain-containing protein [Encephalitozoon cuniculi]